MMTRLLLFIASIVSLALCQVEYGPITKDFEKFLNDKGLASMNYARRDLGNAGSFGGLQENETWSPDQEVVIFFHGNSDAALRANDFSTGWTLTVEYFVSKGYKMSQLYATSWGNTNTTQAVYRDHDCQTVMRLRSFVDAVLDYTGVKYVNIISHSMGVTLARKVIMGGSLVGNDGTCQVGKPLNNRMRAFLGIAGANFGLCACVGHWLGVTWPTCNDENGLWPGEHCYPSGNYGLCAESPLPSPCNAVKYSKFLMDLNSSRSKAAQHVFSMWSTGDDLTGDGNMVWGRPTSEIPQSDGNMIYTNYTHMETKEKTAAVQYDIITQLIIPS